MSDTPDTFESRLKQLSELVSAMERGDLPLDDALRHYEQGIALIRACREQLEHAEQTVKRLQQNGSQETLVPWQDD